MPDADKSSVEKVSVDPSSQLKVTESDSAATHNRPSAVTRELTIFDSSPVKVVVGIGSAVVVVAVVVAAVVVIGMVGVLCSAIVVSVVDVASGVVVASVVLVTAVGVVSVGVVSAGVVSAGVVVGVVTAVSGASAFSGLATLAAMRPADSGSGVEPLDPHDTSIRTTRKVASRMVTPRRFSRRMRPSTTRVDRADVAV